MSLLGSFSSSGSKPRVHVSVTPGVGIEMIQLDLENNQVSNYTFKELAYNETTRDIVDYDVFRDAIADMYAELNINPKCEVVVNMPLVSFGINNSDFGLIVSDDQITGGVTNIVLESYTFKRMEPVVSWISMPNIGGTAGTGEEKRRIVYTALQKVVIEKIGKALEELGSTLVGVENSLTSTFRALDYMGVIETQTQPDTTWNLLLINSTGYSLVSLSGKNVVDYYEEPLPIKSYEGNQIYTEIANSAQIALSSYPANYLLVVSDTDQVSAEIVVSKLRTVSTVSFLENNSLKKQDSLMPVSLNVPPNYASMISLQAIGCALAEVSTFPLKFNYMPSGALGAVEPSCTIAIGEHEYVVTQKSAFILVAAVCLPIILILWLLSSMILPNMQNAQSTKASEVNTNISQIDAQIKEFAPATQTTVFDVSSTVENGVKSNRAKLMNYVAAGEAIPSNVWLTYFMTQGDGLVDIKGVSTDVSAVYVFFKNMRDSLIGTKLKLQKLEMDSQSVDAAVSGAGGNYVFEITNMTEDQLSSLFGQDGGEANPNPQPAPANNQPAPSSDSNLISDKPLED